MKQQHKRAGRIVSLLAVAIVCVFAVYEIAQGLQEQTPQKTIEALVSGKYGHTQKCVDPTGLSVLCYEDEHYLYGFDSSSRLMFIANKLDANNTDGLESLFGSIGDETAAEKIARDIAGIVASDIMESDVAISTTCGRATDSVAEYTVSIRQVSAELYTGNTISVTITQNGDIAILAVLRESINSNFAQKIDETQAIDLAYSAIEQSVTKSFGETVTPDHGSNQKPDDNAVSDAGYNAVEVNEVSTAVFADSILRRSEHTVTTELVVFKGQLKWIVRIRGIQVNSYFDTPAFTVEVNAENGEILRVGRSR